VIEEAQCCVARCQVERTRCEDEQRRPCEEPMKARPQAVSMTVWSVSSESAGSGYGSGTRRKPRFVGMSSAGRSSAFRREWKSREKWKRA
jgi:hypothetical protein